MSFVVLLLVPTGLSDVSTAVSETGLTDYAWTYRWFTVSLAAAGLGAAAMVPSVLGRRQALLVTLLVLFVFGRSFVGWVPMDAPGSATTTTGLVHTVLGLVSFVSFIVLALVAARSLGAATPSWFGKVSRATGLVATIGLVVMVLAPTSPDVEDVFGLFQRMLYVAIVVWFGASAAAATTSRRTAVA